MILDGDDNLLVDGKPVQPGILTLTINSHIAWTKDRHKGYGNIGFADGHVDQVSNDGLNRLLGAATNRLVIP
jgi:prepilin-type processing-associated H-X9-DG protein